MSLTRLNLTQLVFVFCSSCYIWTCLLELFNWPPVALAVFHSMVVDLLLLIDCLLLLPLFGGGGGSVLSLFC